MSRPLLLTLLACLLAALDLPTPAEWAAPIGAPIAPGDGFAISASGGLAAQAPVIAEWNRTVKPDESFTLTGTRFSLRSGDALGSDTRVLVYGWSSGGGVLKEATLWRVGEQLLTATLPADLPFGMYLLWVENEAGASAPVPLNRTQPEWIGPLGERVVPGQTTRVFGKNLSRDHGEASANVYLRPSGGGAFIACAVTRVEPCAVWFTVPSSAAPGAYEVWVHSGHGGAYGWGGPLALTVALPWQRGTDEQAVSPSGGNDSGAIQAAIDAMAVKTAGGTVRLGSGIYTLASGLTLQSKVRLLGAGRNQTLIRPADGANLGLATGASHLALEEMTIRAQSGARFGFYSGSFGGGAFNSDVLLRRCDVLVDSDAVSSTELSLQCERLEVDSCFLQGVVRGSAIDWWIHGCELRGGRGETDGALSFRADRSTGGRHGRCVVEDNHAKTDNWPNNAGNRNYWDWLSGEQWNGLVWCARLIYFQPDCESINYSYIGHNVTEDVAIDDNKGEQILFHSYESRSFAGVASAGARTLSIRSDGVCQGQANWRIYPSSTPAGITPMTSIPDALHYGQDIDGSGWALIVDGTGLGQLRRIVSHTATTITLERDWRVIPDATSTVVLLHVYEGHIQYRNQLAGVPSGWRNDHHIASTGVNYDGNVMHSVAEGNSNTRTYYGDQLQGYVTSFGYWNEMRDEQTISPIVGGPTLTARGGDWGISPSLVQVPGPLLLGSWLRGGSGAKSAGTSAIVEGWGSLPANRPFIVGSGIEGMTVNGGGLGSASYDQSLLRRNVLLGGTGIGLGRYADPWLSGNGSSAISLDGGSAFGVKPTALSRVLRFSRADLAASRTAVIANAGTGAMAWTVTSDQPWLNASVQAGTSPVASESISGRLLVTISSGSLPAGLQRGVVTVTSGSRRTSIGVLVLPALPGDLNGDDLVDAADLAILRDHFGQRSGDGAWLAGADVNGDLRVDAVDLSLIVRGASY